MAIQVHAKWVQITFLSLWGPIMLEQFQNSSGSHISISFSYIHQIYKNNRYKDFFFHLSFYNTLIAKLDGNALTLKSCHFFFNQKILLIKQQDTCQLVNKSCKQKKYLAGNFKQYYLLDFADIYDYHENIKQLNNERKWNERNQAYHIYHVNVWKETSHIIFKHVKLVQNLSLKNLNIFKNK